MRRPVVTLVVTLVFLSAAAYGQSMVEAAAAAAGGTVGGASGKAVSDGVTAIFGKVDKQAASAASASDGKNSSAPNRALIEAGPGQPQPQASSAAGPAAPKPARKPKAPPSVTANTGSEPRRDDVPPPPPLANRTRVVSKPAPAPLVAIIRPAAPPPPPPPPPVTLEDLQKVSAGMARADVLKLGEPAARITMFEDGGLLEIFSYYSHDPELGTRTLGTVRLNDGAVSSVQLRP